jgi:hydrogenase nickel incorporation protein HypA/HybF
MVNNPHGRIHDMHEMSLCERIVHVVEEVARQQHYSKVLSVRLELGILACVEPAALEFCFDSVTKGTIAEGSTLELIQVPAVATCMECNEVFETHRRYDVCPECGNDLLRISGGDEMRIKDMEVQ